MSPRSIHSTRVGHRGPAALAGVLSVALGSAGACDDVPGSVPRAPLPPPEPESAADAETIVSYPGVVPAPGVTLAEPVDVMGTQLRGVRLLRIDRRYEAPVPGATPLAPRYVGRDEHGHLYSLREILLGELRALDWVRRPYGEGTALVLWRGALILDPDGACAWREPTRTERVAGGRRVHVTAHCRTASGGESVRALSVTVAEDYASLVLDPIEPPSSTRPQESRP